MPGILLFAGHALLVLSYRLCTHFSQTAELSGGAFSPENPSRTALCRQTSLTLSLFCRRCEGCPRLVPSTFVLGLFCAFLICDVLLRLQNPPPQDWTGLPHNAIRNEPIPEVADAHPPPVPERCVGLESAAAYGRRGVGEVVVALEEDPKGRPDAAVCTGGDEDSAYDADTVSTDDETSVGSWSAPLTATNRKDVTPPSSPSNGGVYGGGSPGELTTEPLTAEATAEEERFLDSIEEEVVRAEEGQGAESGMDAQSEPLPTQPLGSCAAVKSEQGAVKLEIGDAPVACRAWRWACSLLEGPAVWMRQSLWSLRQK